MFKIRSFKFKPVIDSIYEFDKLPEALSYMKEGKHLGKIVIDFEK